MITGVRTKSYTVALAGQPNTGKSTVFNRLTGAKQHVGNWPGKTVEKKMGFYDYDGNTYNIVDLPGTYSLTANSMEERITRDYLIKENPDVIVVMADAAQLERTLYLLAEIRMLAIPVVLALNMMDIAEGQGKKIDVEILEISAGVPVVPIAAAKGRGIDRLLALVAKTIKTGRSAEKNIHGNSDFIREYQKLKTLISGKIPLPYTEEWIAVKLIENDDEVVNIVKENISLSDFEKVERCMKRIPDGILLAADSRYNWIREILSMALDNSETDKRERKHSGFDRAATHPVWGKLIAVGIMVISFAAAMIIAIPLMSALQAVLPSISLFLREFFSAAPVWVGSLFADGLLPGLFVALCMLSYIFGVYIVFGVLEDVGYLARLAYIFDRSMSKLGLHGKSFMPLLMSFGCNIAGVTGTRVIDSWRQRMVTLVMVPIIPCLALWAVVSFMGMIFFGPGMPLVIISLLLVMVLYLVLTSVLLRKTVLKGESTGLIMELPPYHKPNWNTILGYVWVQVKGFLKRAVTLITVITIFIWALSYQPDGNIENSILASIGRFFDPLSGLMGLDWKLFIALVAAIVAKEASLSVLAVLYGIGQGCMSITSLLIPGSGGFEEASLIGSLTHSISPASALAFIFAFFFSIPCIGTIATINSETRSLGWTAGCSLYYTLISFIAGVLAYHAGLIIF